jgi:hypothetical protein
MSRIALAGGFGGLLILSLLFQPALRSQTQTPADARIPEATS